MKVRELSSIAFGRQRGGTLVTLRAYFDGSGKEDDHPVITMGGFLAESAICELIEKEWETATDGKTFHLTDFGTKHCKLGSLQWTEERRKSFLLRLAEIVNRPDCSIISASIEVARFNEQISEMAHPQEIRANADDFIRISGQFEVDAESASVFRDKADLRIRQRLTIAKQPTHDSSAIRECD